MTIVNGGQSPLRFDIPVNTIAETANGIRVQRSSYVSDTEGLARFLETFTDTVDGPQMTVDGNVILLEGVNASVLGVEDFVFL